MAEPSLRTVEAFRHCGGCGADGVLHEGFAVRCGGCGWRFFTNVAAAAAVVLEFQGRMLLVRRSREPGIGKLGLPGGFIDPGETAAQGVCRELREELRLDLRPEELGFLTTASNVYPYAGVTYHSLDTYFVATLPVWPEWFDAGEISAVELHDAATLDMAQLAFPATREAVRAYRQLRPC